jgi:LPS-assembly protein
MLKLFLLLLFITSSTSLFATSEVKLFATSLSYEDNKTIAHGDALFVKGSLLLRADKILYFHNKNTIEAFGEIYISQAGKNYIVSDYLTMNLSNENLLFDHFFLQNGSSSIWLSAHNTIYKPQNYQLKGAITSSCNPKNPDWSMQFSTGEYDQENEWIHLYNMRLYAGKVPIFYLPYLGFSTISKRQSGLLSSQFGNSNDEGLVFEQPIFIAPSEQWDITLKPQIRELRGKGVFSEFRFVDSPHSQGIIEAGLFTDSDTFVKRANIANKEHKGLHINYERRGLVSKKNDALYVDTTYLNDVEYLSLQNLTLHNQEIPKIIPSYLHYFVEDETQFIGLSNKYFIDTSSQDNGGVLQILPSLDYHLYNNDFGIKYFLSSLDIQNKNFSRQSGATAVEHQVSLPLKYNLSLFDDYLNINFSDATELYDVHYNKHSYSQDRYTAINNIIGVSLISNLAKKYQDFFHTISFESSVNHIENIMQSNTSSQNIYQASPFIDTVGIQTTQDSARLQMSQYLYNLQGEQLFVHRLFQQLNLDSNSSLPDLENEFIFNLKKHFSFIHFLRYSHLHHTLALTSNTLKYEDDFYLFGFTQLYEKSAKTNDVVTNYNRFDAAIRINQSHDFMADYSYDHISDEDRGWSVTYRYKRKCWDIATSFRREITPRLLTDGADSKTNDIIFLRLNLIPFGGFEQQIIKQM